jgi:hypothetical protein
MQLTALKTATLSLLLLLLGFVSAHAQTTPAAPPEESSSPFSAIATWLNHLGAHPVTDANWATPGRTNGAEPAALTPQQEAARDCWQETEHGAKSLPLDKRAKAVDKCVKDKMSGAK